MKKRNYIWDSIDTTNIKGDKLIPFKKSKGNTNWKNALAKVDKKFRKKKNRKQRKYQNRVPRKYKLYIKSKYWKERRDRYFREWGKKCFICGSVRYIVLHHLEYKHTVFGNEPDEMLVQLCKDHHEEFHALYGVSRKMYKDFDDFIDLKHGEQIMEGI